MKNNFRLMVAIFGMTIAIFGSMSSNARKANTGGNCVSYGFCGTSHEGANIEGQYYPN